MSKYYGIVDMTKGMFHDKSGFWALSKAYKSDSMPFALDDPSIKDDGSFNIDVH